MRPHQRFVTPTAGLRVETRGAGSLPKIVGHASVFNQWTTLYDRNGLAVREIVRPGAFRNALKERQDVRALFNHDYDKVLGRTASGTLRLAEDATGLRSEIDPPDTPLGREVATLIGRGDLSGMSFSFLPRPGGYSSREYARDGTLYLDYELTDADLYDVSVVTLPAYPGTDVGLRTLDDARRFLGIPTRAAASGPAVAPAPEAWALDLAPRLY